MFKYPHDIGQVYGKWPIAILTINPRIDWHSVDIKSVHQNKSRDTCCWYYWHISLHSLGVGRCCPLRTVMLSFTTAFKKNISVTSINAGQDMSFSMMLWFWQHSHIVQLFKFAHSIKLKVNPTIKSIFIFLSLINIPCYFTLTTYNIVYFSPFNDNFTNPYSTI